MNRLELYKVYLHSLFEKKHSNDRLEFKSLGEPVFVNKAYRKLFNRVLSRGTISPMEWMALNRQRVIEDTNRLAPRRVKAGGNR